MATRAQENEDILLPPADQAEEIEKLQEDLLNERARNVRMLADFKNYRRHIERDSNKLADELRRGYLWKNELLRPAHVRVAG